MWLLIILIVATVISVTYVIWSALIKSEHLPFSVLCLLLLVIGGWGLIGTGLSVDYKNVETEVKIYKTATRIIVESKEGIIKSFTDIYSYNNITDTTKFYLRKDFNIYKQECYRALEIKK